MYAPLGWVLGFFFEDSVTCLRMGFWQRDLRDMGKCEHYRMETEKTTPVHTFQQGRTEKGWANWLALWLRCRGSVWNPLLYILLQQHEVREKDFQK